MYPALPDILPDIRYMTFGLAGHPAGQISGKTSIRCIPKGYEYRHLLVEYIVLYLWHVRDLQ
jgi:hypothetical protein